MDNKKYLVVVSYTGTFFGECDVCLRTESVSFADSIKEALEIAKENLRNGAASDFAERFSETDEEYDERLEEYISCSMYIPKESLKGFEENGKVMDSHLLLDHEYLTGDDEYQEKNQYTIIRIQ